MVRDQPEWESQRLPDVSAVTVTPVPLLAGEDEGEPDEEHILRGID
ncbi:hypothetical protein ACIRPU_41790 [Streptomyces sp. NPDC102259]